MMTVPMRADAMRSALAAVIAVTLIMINDGVGGGRFRKAGGGIDNGREEEGGEDEGRRHDQFRPCRHRPGHRPVHTFVLAGEQCVTVSTEGTTRHPSLNADAFQCQCDFWSLSRHCRETQLAFHPLCGAPGDHRRC